MIYFITTLSYNAYHLSKTAEMFQRENEASPNSICTAMRLLDITSLIMHELFSNIHNHFHPRPRIIDGGDRTCRLKNLNFSFSNGYRHRTSSIAGYWAETEVFGGPVLFARGESGTEVFRCLFTLLQHISLPPIPVLPDHHTSVAQRLLVLRMTLSPSSPRSKSRLTRPF